MGIVEVEWKRLLRGTTHRHDCQPRRRSDRKPPGAGGLIGITRDTIWRMSDVSIRELRNHGGEVVDRVARGERVTITRAGKAVAELRPVARPPLSGEALLRRRRRLPAVDPVALRADVDAILDARV